MLSDHLRLRSTQSCISETFKPRNLRLLQTISKTTIREANGYRLCSWRAKLLSTTTTVMCTHLWRCTLILCFRADYSNALSCVRVSSAVGDLRLVNNACGRNLAFFLDRLTERVQSGNGSQQQLEIDEEMLAYVSGDMQGCTENSWVWTGSETGMKLNNGSFHFNFGGPLHPSTDVNARDGGDMASDTLGLRPILTDSDKREWGGWERVERMIHHLLDDQRKRAQHPQAYYHQPSHNSGKRLHLAPPEGPAPGPASAGTSPNGTSRISIANII